MKTILLAKGKAIAVVDDEDYERVAAHRWHLISNGACFYAERTGGVLMHRELMNAAENQMIDHRDGDGLNNQRLNLRFCSHAENVRNKRSRINRAHLTSRFKGVCYVPVYADNSRKGRPRAKPWQAQITFNYRKFSRFFSSEEEAARGYDALARQFFGEFACPNFAD